MSTTPSRTRTPAEVLARIEEIADDDLFGFRCEVLACALSFEDVKPLLNENVTAESWAESAEPDTLKAATGYFTFALGKIDNHRSISAERSTLKLAEYAWLLGRDDVVAAMDEADYPQYGAPKVKAFGDALGLEWPTDLEMVRMASGLPCRADCADGCAW